MGITVPLGWISLRSHPYGSDGQEVYCLLGPTPPKPIAGYGGWTTINRPKRRSITQWQNSEPLQIAISLLLDNWRNKDGLTTEHQMEILERMAGYDGKDGDTIPPRITWTANAPHDSNDEKDLRWIVSALEWGDSLRNDSGNIVRQAADLTVMQFEDDEVLRTGARKNRAQRRSKKQFVRKMRRVLVHEGDTLASIAKNELGRAGRWTEIQRLNKDLVRDPDKPPVGRFLTLPD